MKRDLANEEGACSPITKDSTASTFRPSRRTNRQYYSVKKNHPSHSQTSYSSTSPTRNNDFRIKKGSPSP